MSQLAEQNASLKSKLARLREQGELATKKFAGSAMAVAGGAGAGWVEAKYPTLGSSNVSTNVALSLSVGVAALADVGGKYNDELMALANGLAAGTAALATYRRVSVP